jgi:multiple sugar transport system substrate-binding protein
MKLKQGMMLLIAGGAVAGAIALAQAFNEPKYQAAPKGEITLEYWSWVPNMEQQAALFTKQYPNIKVKVVNLGGGQARTRSCKRRSKRGRALLTWPKSNSVTFRSSPARAA